MKAEKPVYRVEVESKGCSCCSAGKWWWIVGPQGYGESQSYSAKADADEECQKLNHVHAQGFRAGVRAARKATR